MPLIVAKLQSDILKLSTSDKPASGTDAANAIASAYESYASQGIAAGFPLIAPGPGRATMAAALIAALNTKPGAPPVVAQGFAAMVTLFWSAAQFVSPIPPGIAAPPAGVGALVPAVTGLLSNSANPAEVYAAQLAAALDACTRTVLVTLPQPPPAPPLIVPVS